MNSYYPVTPYRQPLPSTSANYVEMGRIGAIVGLCGAGAINIRRMQQDGARSTDAIVDTLKVGVASGLATAAATLVANQFRNSSLSLLATLAAGTAVMYALNSETNPRTSGKDQ